MGTLQHIYLIQSELPDWPDFPAENCYLGLELDLQTEASKAEIESVFEFIQELAQIRILPPDSQVEKIICLLIAALPQMKIGFGEILVASGLLTDRQSAKQDGPHSRLQNRPNRPRKRQNRRYDLQSGRTDRGGGSKPPLQAVDAALQKQQQIRDTSKDLGKEIQLQINGAETELDKTVVDKIADPLTHLVRNALDHGIETGRRTAGRRVTCQRGYASNAYHESGNW